MGLCYSIGDYFFPNEQVIKKITHYDTPQYYYQCYRIPPSIYPLANKIIYNGWKCVDKKTKGYIFLKENENIKETLKDCFDTNKCAVEFMN